MQSKEVYTVSMHTIYLGRRTGTGTPEEIAAELACAG
jgi:hypothetical protein